MVGIYGGSPRVVVRIPPERVEYELHLGFNNQYSARANFGERHSRRIFRYWSSHAHVLQGMCCLWVRGRLFRLIEVLLICRKIAICTVDGNNREHILTLDAPQGRVLSQTLLNSVLAQLSDIFYHPCLWPPTQMTSVTECLARDPLNSSRNCKNCLNKAEYFLREREMDVSHGRSAFLPWPGNNIADFTLHYNSKKFKEWAPTNSLVSGLLP